MLRPRRVIEMVDVKWLRSYDLKLPNMLANRPTENKTFVAVLIACTPFGIAEEGLYSSKRVGGWAVTCHSWGPIRITLCGGRAWVRRMLLALPA